MQPAALFCARIAFRRLVSLCAVAAPCRGIATAAWRSHTPCKRLLHRGTPSATASSPVSNAPAGQALFQRATAAASSISADSSIASVNEAATAAAGALELALADPSFASEKSDAAVAALSTDIAELYWRGLGKRDAVGWFERAAALGHAPAMLRLASFSWLGVPNSSGAAGGAWIVPRDRTRACTWWQRILDVSIASTTLAGETGDTTGDSAAETRARFGSQNGRITAPSSPAASAAAAVAPDAVAAYNLGLCAEIGEGGVRRDRRAAAALFARAAAAGHAGARAKVAAAARAATEEGGGSNAQEK
jgi:TPR repeat protein